MKDQGYGMLELYTTSYMMMLCIALCLFIVIHARGTVLHPRFHLEYRPLARVTLNVDEKRTLKCLVGQRGEESHVTVVHATNF